MLKNRQLGWVALFAVMSSSVSSAETVGGAELVSEALTVTTALQEMIQALARVRNWIFAQTEERIRQLGGYEDRELSGWVETDIARTIYESHALASIMLEAEQKLLNRVEFDLARLR